MSSPVEQIKQRLSVVDVVGSYIKLQKAGGNFKACCPFHSEKTPSFYVSPPREIWHCFGCGRGGDMFEFVKQIEGVEFVEALRILADRAGISVVFQKPEFISEKTRLLDLLKEAAGFYQRQLANNREVLDYLWKRGLKNETLKNFNVGFAPAEESGWRHLFDYLKSKGYSGAEMEKAGLVVKKSATDYYDRFRGRIMFPLKDGSGRILGFSGRVFGAEREGVGKYINSPQTILYDKSKILYGFDWAKMDIRKADVCVLVEGQMDVLMSHQAGITNAVAVSGTALTFFHLEIIRRLTNNLVMAFDNDEAGLEAARRSIDLALEKEFEVKAVFLEEGKDPADMVLRDPEEWKKAVVNARHIIDFYLHVLKNKYRDSRDFKMAVQKKVLPYILFIQSGIDRSHWIKKIAQETDVKEEVILEELKKKKMAGAPVNMGNKEQPVVKKRQQLLAERLVGLVLWKKVKKEENQFDSNTKELIFGLIKAMGKSEKEKLIFETELMCGGVENLEQEINNLFGELKKEIKKEKLENLAKEIYEAEKGGEAEKLKEKLDEFKCLSCSLRD